MGGPISQTGREYWDSLSREEKLKLLQGLRAKKWPRARIAREYGIAPGTINTLFNDPTGAKRKARRVKWSGVCETCGGPTFGEGGKTSRFCKQCYKPPPRRWTREKIIAAIQRWNREYGHPPTSTEWISGGEWWPARSHVYGTVHNSKKYEYQNPFPKWADAIEAAGFPRPFPGIKYAHHPRKTDLPWKPLRDKEKGPIKWKKRSRTK